MHHVHLDESACTIQFDRAGVEINLGSIGKGYAVDCAAQVLRHLGVETALIHGGHSTIYGLGAPPPNGETANGRNGESANRRMGASLSYECERADEGWVVGIRHPLNEEEYVAVVTLRDQALSTSGSYEQFFEVDGKRYSHVLDPRTGFPAQGTLSATVITSSATDSDALSTAFFVGGEASAQAYGAAHPEVRVFLVPETSGGGRLSKGV
jgi:thiamine biosynthesis lipoprotein